MLEKMPIARRSPMALSRGMLSALRLMNPNNTSPSLPSTRHARRGNTAGCGCEPNSVVRLYGYHPAELNRVAKLTRQHQDRLLEFWNAHFSQ